MKYNSFEFEIKSLGEDGTIEGYGSMFGNPDSYNDIVAKGAFRKTLRERSPALLWQHDPTQVIGVWEYVKENDKGLRMKGKINLDVQKGREAYSLLRQGAVKGLSIGFSPVKYQTDSKTKVRTLTEVKLFEVSIVTFPANESATVTSVKSQITTILETLDFNEQQKVLGYAEAIKSLQLQEPDTTIEDDTETVDNDHTDVKGMEDLVHSEEEADTKDQNEPHTHSLDNIRKLTKILKGE